MDVILGDPGRRMAHDLGERLDVHPVHDRARAEGVAEPDEF
jgi:hypothetical protein